ncbi:MAG: DUF4826 family protein [Gammaproteobacteria bacterium]|nr:DUF4826 family protein [Gammaproteobacteria bacterium]
MGFKTEQDVEKFAEWLKEQIQGMSRHVYASGLFSVEATGHCVWSVPHLVFLGQIWPKDDRSSKYWVISGLDLPTDHFEEGLAATPREALRHFSMKWQLQSSKVAELGEQGGSDGAVSSATDWQRIADGLQSNAEALYTLVERDELWDAEKGAVDNVLAAVGQQGADEPVQ